MGIEKYASFASDIIRVLRKRLGLKGHAITDFSGLGRVRSSVNVDVRKAFKIMFLRESGGTYAIGDQGTSYGVTQLQVGNFLTGLAKDRKSQQLTGISSEKYNQLYKLWVKALTSVKRARILKKVPVDMKALKEFRKRNPSKKRDRRDSTAIFYSPTNRPGVVKISNGVVTGWELDYDALEKLGINVTQNDQRLRRLMRKYITHAVTKSAVAKIIMEQSPTFRNFDKMFQVANVKSSKSLRDLADRVSERDFTNRIRRVVSAVEKSGYDVTKPNAYNIYQLIVISNASGLGPIYKFLRKKRPFAQVHLHYLSLKTNNSIQKITGLSSSVPSRGGLDGFK